MGRAFLEVSVLFLAPFAAYFAWLNLREIYPLAMEHWTVGRLAWLTCCGLALVIAGMVAIGFLASHRQGLYHPAHVENGRLVPGHMDEH
ncbi:DUF6111 family protein [Methylovirgula sp. 4M-Z18]|uniref:DUF6111 family protein n=1 Tax=Methylovirgula sp. 4M-Z18 TaxID=2293567 RepID=UPI000E2F1D59|nr:DUF6111 family protein [Methylovirgula sp. 4M-Z18]RFB79294.1 hypothetical protein DYH55_12050 [Methylovirgula sp. 4M-Z18]